VKNENELLKAKVNELDSINEKYRQEEFQRYIIENSKKYAFVVIKYSDCIAWQGSECIERKTRYLISEIDKVPYSLTESDKYKIMDDIQAFAPVYGDNYIINREIFVFDTYAEASQNRQKLINKTQ
jgi:hypothetical protein